MSGSERPSLTDGELDEVWERARERLERAGADNRGRLTTPPLSSEARRRLGALLGRPLGKTIDLASLEAALVGLDVGVDLGASLEALGHPVSSEPMRRRADRRLGRVARDAARAAAAAWPEAWSESWIDDVIRSGALRGLDGTRAVALVADVRTVLDALAIEQAPVISRVDLAAAQFGSAHALDTGSRLEAATTRALAHALGPADPRELWGRSGVHLDLVSGPVLTWNLCLDEVSPLGRLTRTATELGLPLHLTQMALREHRITAVGPDTVVLVVENPRVVEAAAQRRAPSCVIATNGNPSGAVRILVAQLLAAGAAMRYHGDFDAAGLAICGRMAQLGLRPWRMNADDYVEAIDAADAAGIALPLDARPAPPTPWDGRLQSVFDADRRIVHEERLLDQLLTPS